MTSGRHDMKFGGEYLRWHDTGQWQLLSRGDDIFTSTPPDMNRRFPASAWNDPTKWDVTGLDASVQRFDQNFGDWTIDIPRPTWAVWFGDTWRMNDSLTVNYGVRWDADWGALDPPHITTQAKFNPAGGAPYPDIDLGPGDLLYPNNLRDIGSVAPRGGFAWNVGGNSNFVFRGGSGLYYSIPDSNTTFSIQSFNGERILVNSFPNVDSPASSRIRRGDAPRRTSAPAGSRCRRRQSPRVIAHDYQMPSTWQSIIGFQKQLGAQLGIETDLTHWKGYRLARVAGLRTCSSIPPPGTTANPAQGVLIPAYTQTRSSSQRATRLGGDPRTRKARRYAVTGRPRCLYTLMLFMNDDTTNFQYQVNNPFRPDDDWARSTDFQRHTIRFNGIWRLALLYVAVRRLLVWVGQLLLDDLRREPVRSHGHEPVRDGAAHGDSGRAG